VPTRRVISSTKFVSVDNDDGYVYHFNLRNILYAVENGKEATVTVVFNSGHQIELQDHVAALLIEELRSKNLLQKEIQNEQLTDTAFEFTLETARDAVDASDLSVIQDEGDDLADIPAKISAAMKENRQAKRRRK